MDIIKTCVDYEILKSKLDIDTLNKIDKVLKHYENYIKKNDDGIKDIIGEYYDIYGNGFVVDWYEGLMSTEEFIEELENGYEIDLSIYIRSKLNKLVKDEYLWGYGINGNEITIRYGLSSVKDTERVFYVDDNKTLQQALLESAEELEADIMFSLEDDNDFFGYDNEEELKDRIAEETDYLKLLSTLV